ncbi:MAG: hypothetical protein ABFC31_12465 [Clostridiaceae bacterium]
MEKVIQIAGRDVGFKAAASLPVRYYNATGRDLFVDLQTLADGTDQVEAKPKFWKKKPESSETATKADKKKAEETQYRLNRDWNTMVLYGIVHTMARAYDEAVTPNLDDWLDDFDAFPIFEVFGELKPLLNASLQTSKK